MSNIRRMLEIVNEIDLWEKTNHGEVSPMRYDLLEILIDCVDLHPFLKINWDLIKAIRHSPMKEGD